LARQKVPLGDWIHPRSTTASDKLPEVSAELRGVADPEALDLVRGGLRFARPETEADYRAWHVRKALPFIRAGLVSAIVAWTAALMVGFLVMPDAVILPAAEWVFGLMIPVLLASLATTYRSRLLAWVMPSMILNIAVAGVEAVGLSFHYHLPEMAMVGVITFVFFAFTVVRLHLLDAIAAVVPCVALNQGLLIAWYASGAATAARLGIYSLGAANAVVTALFAGAALDRVSRERFRQERLIEAQSQTIERERARADVAERSRQLSEALLRLSGALGKAAPLAPGDVVEDRYRVLRALGRGGMGQVHEVERLADGRRLALKVLTGVVDRVALARFAREAQIAAQLDHPNVVAVLDVGVSQSGMLFLVMDLVTGSTLAAERARYGDATWALPILRQVATALAALHTRGIVHRDLKPANVLLDDRGAQVADFGLASLAEPADRLDPNASTLSPMSQPQLTHPGAFMGTPSYMAPELTRGAREALPAADVWSFGVIAHELLTGAPPFSEAPVLAQLAGRSAAPAAPLDAPTLPAALRALLDACLCVDPAERPTSAALRDAFDACSPALGLDRQA
jgi:hypothetical protein